MKQIFSVFLIIAWTFSSYSQTRCFTYDAAGNRTVRMACLLPLNTNDLIDGVERHLVEAVAGAIGGSAQAAKQQLLTNDFSSLAVYPNPSVGVFRVEGTFETSASLRVYDSSGKAVWVRDHIPDEIDLMHLPNGSYYMVIYEGSNIKSALLNITK